MGALVPISSARRLLVQPLLGFCWELIFTDAPAEVAPYIERLMTRVRVSAAPGRGGKVFDTYFGPYVFTHHGKRDYPRRVTLQFEESYKQQVMPVLDLWSRLIFDEESAEGVPEEQYKASMWLRFVGPGNEFKEAIHVYGSYPSREDDSPLAYNSEAQVMRGTVFAYDFWRWERWPA